MTWAQAVEDLVRATKEFGDLYKPNELALRLDEASHLAQSWLNYCELGHLTGCADELLRGCRSAHLEAISCCCLGLARPAIFSMRAQVDMALAWIYFKDHRVEWDVVEESSEGFMLKASVYEYLKKVVPKFEARIKLLADNRTHNLGDPYRFLSAHVHSQSSATAPSGTSLSCVVASQDITSDVVAIQLATSELISDWFSVCFVQSEWNAIPANVQDNLKSRLSSSQLSQLVNANFS